MDFVKQFPDLMAGKTIMYVHGFASSGQSGTVGRLRTVFPHARVVAPDLPLHPQEALDLLRRLCETEHPDLIIGTSMGGMFTEMLYGYDRICVNPAFCIADTMSEHGLTGKQQFFSPRQDGVQEFYVDKPLVKEYKAITEQNFNRVDERDEQHHVFGLFGDEDDLVDTRELFSQHYTQDIPFHGGHRMNDHSFMHSIVPVIRWIDDRQEHHQRPIIYIGIESLIPRSLQTKKEPQPQPSAVKAVRLLIEHYEVFFVSPPPVGGTCEEAAWLTEYVGVPAWQHTIYTHRRSLLYGDYFIEDSGDGSQEELLCTRIAYGSDTFKTWDDIITYFERLAGQ